ncbi:hypothetical protein C7212DRAFT_175948, partial [Tuber magnatum]
IAFCFPLHLTNILQTLDVIVFSHYKKFYSQILKYEFQYRRFGFTKKTFWLLLAEAQLKVFMEAIIKSTFTYTCILPLN